MKIFLLFAILFLSSVQGSQFTSVWGAYVANINIQLPNLAYKVGDATLQLNNGVLTQPTGGILSATLDNRILNADFNNDSYPDAAVVLTVVYDGIGYFSKIVFVVLQNYATGAKPTNGIHIGIATYKIDLFSMDSENKKIIVGFMDRLPGQPKAALPTVPTIFTLAFVDSSLVTDSTKTLDASCYPYY